MIRAGDRELIELGRSVELLFLSKIVTCKYGIGFQAVSLSPERQREANTHETVLYVLT